MHRRCVVLFLLLGCLLIGLVDGSPLLIQSANRQGGMVESGTFLGLPAMGGSAWPWSRVTPVSGMGVPPLPGGGTFNEDFLTTTYQDGGQTNASGWGSGTLRLPRNTPTLAGSYNTTGFSRGVWVEGDYAFVADGLQGLQVINITDPTQPALAGAYDTPGSAWEVCVRGDFAFVADGTQELQVINITDPTQPTLAGAYTFLGNVRSVWVSGNYAYLADQSGTLQVVNITVPTQPSLAGSISTSSMALGVCVSGNYAYIADYTAGLMVVNLTNPALPSLADTIDRGGYYDGVYVSGDYVYVATGPSGLQVFNITNPYQLSLAGSYDTGDWAYQVWVEGDFAYVADGGTGLQVLNITNPSQPTWAGSYNTPGYAWDVTVSGNHAFVADNNQGLHVITIADYATPSFAGSYTTGDGTEVFVSGDYAYITNLDQGLYVINITIPSQPTLAGTYNTPGDEYGVFVSGNYAYIASWDQGLYVINITIPSQPTLAGTYNTPSLARRVFVSGDYAYVTDCDSGLQVINVSNPSQPTLAGTYDTPDIAWDVFVSGDYAYVADWESGLQIINITIPSQPTLAGNYSYNPPDEARGVFVSGDYAYVGNSGSGLQIINVTNPSHPTLAGSYDPSYADGVFVSGNYAYLGGHAQGLHIINVTNPLQPSLVSTYDTPTRARDVFVSGDYAYVADESPGLLVIEVQHNRCRQYATPAIAQSLSVHSESSASITRATLTVTETTPADTTLTYELSADDGLHWEAVTVGVEYTFTYPGTSLRWHTHFSTTNSVKTPALEALSLSYTTRLYGPTQTAPSDGAFTAETTPTFDWTLITGAVEYLLQLDTAMSFDSPNLRNLTVVTPPHVLTIPLTDGLWYWRVAGNDSAGDLGFFSSRWDLTIDTTPPTWDQIPIDQVVGFNTAFRYDLNASDPAGLDTWWINDTTHFTIDGDGLITNATLLSLTTYGLQVWVNDTLNNVQTAEFVVTVGDITSPTWDVLPTDQVVELGALFTYDLDASDPSGIDHYWINDTVRFAIDGSGQITNSSPLQIGMYGLCVRAYDPFNNFCEANFTVTVEDTTAPTWLQVPGDHVLEFHGGSLEYQLYATDLSGIHHWWLNDTSHFELSQTGILYSQDPLAVGIYGLEVRVYDPYNNYLIGIFQVMVQDTQPPEITMPTQLDLMVGESYTLTATDPSGIHQWFINDTVHFTIESPHELTVLEGTPSGSYYVNITAVDPYDNSASKVITVIVSVTGGTTPPIPGFPVLAVALGLVVALGTALYMRHQKSAKQGKR